MKYTLLMLVMAAASAAGNQLITDVPTCLLSDRYGQECAGAGDDKPYGCNKKNVMPNRGGSCASIADAKAGNNYDECPGQASMKKVKSCSPVQSATQKQIPKCDGTHWVCTYTAAGAAPQKVDWVSNNANGAANCGGPINTVDIVGLPADATMPSPCCSPSATPGN